MKKTTALFLLLTLFSSCKGQSSKRVPITYVKKLESGLKGLVQETVSYICEVKNDSIPIDTTNYSMRIITRYDSIGNIATLNTLVGSQDSKTELSMIYSGTGKNLSCKIKSRFGKEAEKESNSRILWLDNYNYTFDSHKDTNSVVFTLDKHFRAVKTVFKTRDKVWMTQEFKYNYINNKLHEKINKITENRNNGEKQITYQVQVAQEYDQYGNPTVVYGYIDLEQKNLRRVHFTAYKYYEQ